MDLRSIKVHLLRRHVRAVVHEAGGARGADLDGQRYDRVLVAAGPLLAALAEPTLRALSIDLQGRIVRLSLEGACGRRLDGAAYDRLAPAIGDLARATFAEIRVRPPLPPGGVSTAGFWDQLYRSGGDGWELGRASPPLARWFAAHGALAAGREALVVGCGRGHEAALLDGAGARVVAVDLAGEAIAAARALHGGGSIQFRQADLFELPAAPERFDLVVEHCCFCAIDPARRDGYVDAVSDVLRPGGDLVGLFWSHGRPGGPPFTVDESELLATFSRRFTLRHLETPTDSVGLRIGQERLAWFTLP